MNTLELYIKGKLHRFSGPSSWSELSNQQAVSLMRLRAQVQTKPETLFVAIKLLYGMNHRQQQWLFDERFLRRKKLDEESILLTLDMGQQLLDSLDWIGQDDSAASFPASFQLYDYQFGTPRIWLKRLLHKQRYAGPKAALSSCTFAEFMFADKAFREGKLALMAAILYRPVLIDAPEEPQPLDRDGIEARARLFARLDAALLERIAFAYGSTLLLLQRSFGLVFPQKTESDTTAKKSKKAGNWLDVAIGMAKLDVTKVALVEKTNLYLALKVLNEQLWQAEEMERQLEKMKTK
ncbi:hypothetical protein G8759_20070 [Spirosoma aureum]|uniref:Uncharacterized protein n=1 Tax=Spirosoma aureum TaxID=2692134 RepID=A0A6G9AQY8_9BACT|nr:hypothetical protein [Spirosoma aureum]QIP14749.1 hypothetical protein G8759_20070 [Spirosoma aureum]